MSFIKIDSTLYFSYDYNEIFSNEVISILKECDKIYFNNYNDCDICFEKNNLYVPSNKKCKKSIFNKSIDNLPDSIINLTFGFKFNQPINNLPNSITHLILGFCFTQSLDNLPNSIIHLILGWEFNQLIDNLPNSIIAKKLV